MLNSRFSLNHFLINLDTVGVPRDGIRRQPVEISGFGGNYSYNLGFVNLDLTIGSVRVAHRLHVIDSKWSITYYSDDHGSITIKPSLSVQLILKAIKKGRMVRINAMEFHFQETRPTFRKHIPISSSKREK